MFHRNTAIALAAGLLAHGAAVAQSARQFESRDPELSGHRVEDLHAACLGSRSAHNVDELCARIFHG